ncbi:MAG: cell envelope integrity protein CreD, partial [Bradymonadaceae bacterium]
IYQVLLYGSSLSFRGHFARPDFDKLDLETGRPRWDKAYLSFGIADLTGIKETIQVHFDGDQYEFNPSVPTDEVLSSGVSVPLDLGGGSATSSPPADDATFDFAFDVKLNGRKKLHFSPVGKSTKVHLEADTGSPSFDGDFLPDSRTIEQNQFRADWSILDLNREFPQQWTGSGPTIETTTFGVQLMTPVDHYQKSKRSTKYGLLFIVLTFTVFFFAEVLKRHRIHPIQYLMVGAALCVFFILLLALSEHIGFNLAYLLASTGVIGLITGYSKSVLKDGAPTAIVAAALVALYTFLFSILQLEMYALLIGSLGLFAVLAAVMFLSRNVEWYRQMSRDGEV